jgi:chromosome segregation ATPase
MSIETQDKKHLEEMRSTFQKLERDHKKLTMEKADVVRELSDLKTKHKALEAEHERLRFVASMVLTGARHTQNEIMRLYALANDENADTEQWMSEAMSFVQSVAGDATSVETQINDAIKAEEAPAEQSR